MGTVTRMPGTPWQAPGRELGKCQWCRGADAVREVEVTPAKRKATGLALQPHERAVVVAACGSCAPKLERQVEERERERDRLAAEKKAAKR